MPAIFRHAGAATQRKGMGMDEMRRSENGLRALRPARVMCLLLALLLAVAGAPASIEAEPADASARAGRWIEVVLSQQRLIAWENGRAVMSSPISSGLARTPTRRGTFRIQKKYIAVRMRGPGYDLPRVPYTMFYSGNYAIHGAYWHNNFGRPMSHGCVNLPVSFARRLYEWAPRGTLVVIR